MYARKFILSLSLALVTALIWFNSTSAPKRYMPDTPRHLELDLTAALDITDLAVPESVVADTLSFNLPKVSGYMNYRIATVTNNEGQRRTIFHCETHFRDKEEMRAWLTQLQQFGVGGNLYNGAVDLKLPRPDGQGWLELPGLRYRLADMTA